MDMNRIAKLRAIVASRQAAMVEGFLVDISTATAIIACYDAPGIKQRTKEIIESAALDKVAQVAWKVIR